ncbi:pimeloyl-ACP methyl ester carboxylesterase [Allocatelliglobosispora scoriae]|uniref:Pimeloyl-ACP methyl ester carboxylesterase n=1 Tax=Allocatelliglobosispora scoriae TaxID=643052 RepID=A0A841C640_9ACTN|nr:alpha/beta hydrolase [Allocatelliglobosispora scoriae]MBB5874400.1 pimeloyl-ACP methyl ester carboxylesterase [Allocatelliglobosispora scoriae]
MTVTPRERQEIDRANASGRTPVVFVHGLWMLAGSWQPWREFFEANGYTTVAPGWPEDPETVGEARRRPEVFAGTKVRDVTDHMAEVIAGLAVRPAVVGHSFGGLITQQLAGRGLAAVSVPIDSAPFRGVLPLPVSALRGAWPVIGNPLNYGRSVTLTYEQFRFAFANAVDENEARQLYDAYPVAGSGKPLFQAATANINPWTQIKVDTRNPERGPMLIISGARDHIAPWAIANASFKKQQRNAAVTEIVEIPDRGHSLVLDRGWRDVAETALAFVARHHPANG